MLDATKIAALFVKATVQMFALCVKIKIIQTVYTVKILKNLNVLIVMEPA